MTDSLNIPAHETGKVRVFSLDMPADRVKAVRDPGGPDGVLGALQVDPAYIEIFPVSDLERLGLAGYLIEGCGIPPEQVAPDRTKLQALGGHVMLVLSRAFGGRAVTLHPSPEIRLVGTYSETPLDWTAAPLDSDSARPRVGTTPSPRAVRARSRQIGGSIFAVVMALILLGLFLVLR